MTDAETCSETEFAWVQASLERIVSDIMTIADHGFELIDVATERMFRRPAGERQVHISFRFVLESDAGEAQGCLLVPLPDALALAGFLLMMPIDAVTRTRSRTQLDSATKDALLEVSNFVARAIHDSLDERDFREVRVHSDGCQGVRADVRPSLDYNEGDLLIVGRARARLAGFPDFEMLFLLPDVARLAA